MNKRLLSDLRDLDLDRRAIQMMHDDIEEISADIKSLDADIERHSGDIKTALALRRERLAGERDALMTSMIGTVNHVRRMERLLQTLSPEEQQVIERMIVNSYPGCVFDLMEELHCEKSSIYNTRARALRKLSRLRYGPASE